MTIIGHTCMWALGRALVLAGARLLELDSRELNVEPKARDAGEIGILLYDTIPGGTARRSRNRASFVGPSSMWAPFMPAKPALECGSSSYRLPPLFHRAIAPELERERR